MSQVVRKGHRSRTRRVSMKCIALVGCCVRLCRRVASLAPISPIRAHSKASCCERWLLQCRRCRVQSVVCVACGLQGCSGHVDSARSFRKTAATLIRLLPRFRGGGSQSMAIETQATEPKQEGRVAASIFGESSPTTLAQALATLCCEMASARNAAKIDLLEVRVFGQGVRASG